MQLWTNITHQCSKEVFNEWRRPECWIKIFVYITTRHHLKVGPEICAMKYKKEEINANQSIQLLHCDVAVFCETKVTSLVEIKIRALQRGVVYKYMVMTKPIVTQETFQNHRKRSDWAIKL